MYKIEDSIQFEGEIRWKVQIDGREDFKDEMCKK